MLISAAFAFLIFTVLPPKAPVTLLTLSTSYRPDLALPSIVSRIR
jgi:hypothetical protein